MASDKYAVLWRKCHRPSPMVPSNYGPLRIIHTIPGPSTAGGSGDTMVDENGNHWRVMDEFERSGTPTLVGVTRTIRDGYLW